MSLQQYRVPAFCPCCSLPMKGKSTQTFYDWNVCVLCFINFIEDREERWRSGWRPSEKEIENSVLMASSS